MKKHFKVVFLLCSLLFLVNTAKCTSANNSFKACIISSCISSVSSGSIMHGNSQAKKQIVVLFHHGIEEKNLALPGAANWPAICTGQQFTDNALINKARVKHVLSFSSFLILSPEFLFSFSFRPPPANC